VAYSVQVGVIVVTSQQSVRTTLADYLGQQRFQVWTAGSGDEALAILQRHKVAVMLADVRLPRTSGVELIPRALAIEPDLAIVILTSAPAATTATLCLQRGAMDYLILPLALEDLGRAVRRALKHRKLLALTRTLESRRRQYDLERMAVATLEAMVLALEAKDPYLRGHSARVAELSAAIAAELGFPEDEVEQLRIAGRLHDIGEVGTMESVLDKRGPLTPEEHNHVRQHVVIGGQILALLSPLGVVSGYVRSHHERWDGSGYPDRLRGEDIPLGARILGAAETYDALTTPRPYQEPVAREEALTRIGQLSGTGLDPRVCVALARVVAERDTVLLDEEGVGPPAPSALTPPLGPPAEGG
jgi:putative two-component system response regulator